MTRDALGTCRILVQDDAQEPAVRAHIHLRGSAGLDFRVGSVDTLDIDPKVLHHAVAADVDRAHRWWPPHPGPPGTPTSRIPQSSTACSRAWRVMASATGWVRPCSAVAASWRTSMAVMWSSSGIDAHHAGLALRKRAGLVEDDACPPGPVAPARDRCASGCRCAPQRSARPESP